MRKAGSVLPPEQHYCTQDHGGGCSHSCPRAMLCMHGALASKTLTNPHAGCSGRRNVSVRFMPQRSMLKQGLSGANPGKHRRGLLAQETVRLCTSLDAPMPAHQRSHHTLEYPNPTITDAHLRMALDAQHAPALPNQLAHHTLEYPNPAFTDAHLRIALDAQHAPALPHQLAHHTLEYPNPTNTDAHLRMALDAQHAPALPYQLAHDRCQVAAACTRPILPQLSGQSPLSPPQSHPHLACGKYYDKYANYCTCNGQSSEGAIHPVPPVPEPTSSTLHPGCRFSSSSSSAVACMCGAEMVCWFPIGMGTSCACAAVSRAL